MQEIIFLDAAKTLKVYFLALLVFSEHEKKIKFLHRKEIYDRDSFKIFS